MIQFKDIQNYYDYLEKDNNMHNDYSIWESLREEIYRLIENSQDALLKSHLHYEVYFIEFRISGKLEPIEKYTNGYEYPNIGLFDDNLEYIKTRAENCINPKYKAKYNHILWSSKNNKYAKLAIDNYLKFLETVTFELQDKFSNHHFGEYFETLFILGQSINYKRDEILDFVISILGKQKLDTWREYHLMYFITREGKKNKESELSIFYDYSTKVINENLYLDYRDKEAYLELIIIICQKLKKSPKEFHNKRGDLFIEESEKHRGSFIIANYYLKALNEYKKAQNLEKFEEVSVLMEKSKNDIHLDSVTIELKDKDGLMKDCFDSLDNKISYLIDNYSSTEIFRYLATCEEIFPEAELLNKKDESSFLDLITTINFDINQNVNKENKNIINQYFLYINMFSLRHLSLVFTKGIKSGKISCETLVGYLKEYTWYKYIFDSKEQKGFNWIELLSPSLHSFFTQFEDDIKSNKFDSKGYILSIDSLILKFEGLLRELSRNIGVRTIEIKENGTEARISFEKLLENPKILSLIPEDDVALFKFLFYPEYNMNYRNNIAHCFYKTEKYSPEIMLLLITALLRLGNFDFKIKKNDQ